LLSRGQHVEERRRLTASASLVDIPKEGIQLEWGVSRHCNRIDDDDDFSFSLF